MNEKKGLIFNIQKFSIHDGPGIRTTVFMKGCPLHCRWCSNPESQNPEPQLLDGEIDSTWYSIDEVVEICMQDEPFYAESGGGVTISGGEPLSQPSFTIRLLEMLKARNIHTAIETTGYVKPEVFAVAADFADLLLYDVKHYDSKAHHAGTGVDTDLIYYNLKASIEASHDVLPRIPVIPGFNAKPVDAERLADLLNCAGAKKVQLLPFHRFGEKKYALLGIPYEMKTYKTLYPEHLENYRQHFLNKGIEAFF